MLRPDTHSMTTPRFLSSLIFASLILVCVSNSYAQTFTPTSTKTPTSTFTSTSTKTQTFTPTITNTPTITDTPLPSNTPTDSPTANLTLTPPCGAAATYFGYINTPVVNGNLTNGPGIYGCACTLYSPVSIYSISVYSDYPNPGTSLIAGIYSGSVSNIGNLIVQSQAQNVVNGWNGFALPPTQLSAPATYWLVYMYSPTNYEVSNTAGVSNSNNIVFTTAAQSFGSLPNSLPVSQYAYGNGSVPIYANYCLVPTATPTVTSTITQTLTSTISFTPTATFTVTNTGTINTNTPILTPTYTPSPTPTLTNTQTTTFTPNQSLTPPCGSGVTYFGDANSAGGPATAPAIEMRADFYNLPQEGTVYTMSLYCPSNSLNSGVYAETAIYNAVGSGVTWTMGNLAAQSVTYLIMTPGQWNVFQMNPTDLPAGNYWLTYEFDAPVSYVLNYQNYPSSGVTNVIGYVVSPTAWAFPSSASGFGYPVSYFSVTTGGNNGWDSIYASFCPGNLTTPSSTPTVTSTNTPALTFTPTYSPTVTYTYTVSNTPTITLTPTNTGTATWTPTLTYTSTNTGTPTMTNTNTITYTPTETLTPTFTPTSTWTSTPTSSFTTTNTTTITYTPTNTNSLTFTWSPTNTSTPTWSSTPTNTGTATYTPSVTNTPTITNTPTNTVSPTNTLTPTWTSTPTNTGTWTYTPTITNTPTNTWSPTNTTTPSWTPAWTVTNTTTNTPTWTATFTVSNSPSPTFTFTPTPTPTWTSTGTTTVTPSFTPATTLSTNQPPVIYPNPVKGNDTIQIALTFSQPHDYVMVKIFTTAYRKIYQRTWPYVPAGAYSLTLDDFDLTKISNGLFYALVTTPSDKWLKKVLVLR